MKKKMNQATIKTNAGVARDAATDAKDYADKAAASCRGAVANAADARVQANVAKNASADSNRYYNATKAYAADTLEHRKHAENAVISARHEASSAMYCVIWCVIGTAISIAACIFSIYH